IRAMLRARGDRTVFISLLLLRSEDHEGREYPTPRARAGLSRKRPDATSARGNGQAGWAPAARRRDRSRAGVSRSGTRVVRWEKRVVFGNSTRTRFVASKQTRRGWGGTPQIRWIPARTPPQRRWLPVRQASS